MRIWIDGYEANVSQRLGSSQVAFELIKHLEQIDKKNDYTVLLPNSPFDDLPKERDGWKYEILKPKKLWTRITLPLALYTAKQKPNIFFSPTHYIPRFSPLSVKKIVTIFDLSFLRFPEMFTKKDLWQLKNWTRFSAEFADHIITISNFSKEDIMKQYKIRKEKITVVYPGFDRELFKPAANDVLVNTLNCYNLQPKTYYLFVGTVQPRKNLERLIKAFSVIASHVPDGTWRGNLLGVGRLLRRPSTSLRTPRNDELKLVVAGSKGWLADEIYQLPKKLGIEEKVKFLGYVPEEDLPALYSGAIAFIQPSLWEGFGIPVVEAMAVGVPVIVSNVSSLPEVVGKAGLLVDPYSVDQIEQAMRIIASDKALRQKYSKAGLIRIKDFSWDKMAETVLKVFKTFETPRVSS